MCKNIDFDITKFELIHNFEIVFEENFNLTNLTTNKNFIRYKNFQNFVIVEYFYRNVNKFQFKTSIFQTLNYNQQFFIINFVIAFN